MPALDPALPSLPPPSLPPPVDTKRAERLATYLCNTLMRYCAHMGISTATLSARTGISIWTIRGLRHKKVKNYPQLLNFVKLLAAADLELQIVRAEANLAPDDPTQDPQLPAHYNAGTEGTVQWRPTD